MCQELHSLTRKKKDAQRRFDEAMTAMRGLNTEGFQASLETLTTCKEELNVAVRAMDDHKAEHGCREREVNIRFVAHLGAQI
jgi:hypothetical protein